MSVGNLLVTSTAAVVLSFQLSLLVSAQAPDCIPYTLPSSSSSSELQCSSHLTPCHYVTTPTTTPTTTAGTAPLLSLSATERQLERIVSQIQPDLSSGTIQRECYDGFIFLYCLQTYVVCGQEVGGAYVPGAGTLGACAGDCVRVVNETCGESGWSYLTNIVEQLRGGDLPPLLAGTAECGGGEVGGKQSCLSLEQGDNNNDTECATSEATPTTTVAMPTTSALILGVVLAVCIAFPLLVLTVVLHVLSILYLLRRRRKKQSRSQPTTPLRRGDKTGDNRGRVQVQVPLPPSDLRQSSGTLMLRASTAHEALLDINLSPRTTTLAKRLKTAAFLGLPVKERLRQLEYPRGNICLVRDLWETNFGPVYIGEASGLDHTSNNCALTSVFVKSLRNRASAKLRQQFRIEMTWASGFSHPNIISLLGVCLKEEPQYMLYEYLEYGSLKEFLQSVSSMNLDFDQFLGDDDDDDDYDEGGASERGVASSLMEEVPSQSVFGVDDLTAMACQVADGMDYLAKKAFVLKDLAARNCQVGHNLTVKIANFGLSYDRCSEDYCCIRSNKSVPVPLRWLAPEAIRHNKVSVYSDIWSYGILLWEIFSFGARPYSDLSNAAVVQRVLGSVAGGQGQPLPRPDRCPQGVYGIMVRCWNATPSKRPWFHTLRPELAELGGGASAVIGTEKRMSIMNLFPPTTPEIARASRTSAAAATDAT